MSSSQEKIEIGRQLTSYRNNDGLFGSSMLMDNVPHMYWNNLMLFKSAATSFFTFSSDGRLGSAKEDSLNPVSIRNI
jgi:hypothetical protein